MADFCFFRYFLRRKFKLVSLFWRKLFATVTAANDGKIKKTKQNTALRQNARVEYTKTKICRVRLELVSRQFVCFCKLIRDLR